MASQPLDLDAVRADLATLAAWSALTGVQFAVTVPRLAVTDLRDRMAAAVSGMVARIEELEHENEILRTAVKNGNG